MSSGTSKILKAVMVAGLAVAKSKELRQLKIFREPELAILFLKWSFAILPKKTLTPQYPTASNPRQLVRTPQISPLNILDKTAHAISLHSHPLSASVLNYVKKNQT